MEADEILDLDLESALGAEQGPSRQTLGVYVPDRDRDGIEIGTQRWWVLRVVELLSEIGGGASTQELEGTWFDPAAGRLVWEHPILVFTHIKAELFAANLERLKALVHRMGRETGQGEVVVVFGDRFYRIKDFDP